MPKRWLSNKRLNEDMTSFTTITTKYAPICCSFAETYPPKDVPTVPSKETAVKEATVAVDPHTLEIGDRVECVVDGETHMSTVVAVEPEAKPVPKLVAALIDPPKVVEPPIKEEPKKRTLAECWALYRDPKASHTKLTEEELIAMMQSCVDAITILDQIDPVYYRVITDSIRWPRGYFDLELVVRGRCIEDYPKLPPEAV